MDTSPDVGGTTVREDPRAWTELGEAHHPCRRHEVHHASLDAFQEPPEERESLGDGGPPGTVAVEERNMIPRPTASPGVERFRDRAPEREEWLQLNASLHFRLEGVVGFLEERYQWVFLPPAPGGVSNACTLERFKEIPSQ